MTNNLEVRVRAIEVFLGLVAIGIMVVLIYYKATK